MNKYDEKSFMELTDKVIEWMNNNCHPHHTIIITSTHAELLEGQLVQYKTKYVRD